MGKKGKSTGKGEEDNDEEEEEEEEEEDDIHVAASNGDADVLRELIKQVCIDPRFVS